MSVKMLYFHLSGQKISSARCRPLHFMHTGEWLHESSYGCCSILHFMHSMQCIVLLCGSLHTQHLAREQQLVKRWLSFQHFVHCQRQGCSVQCLDLTWSPNIKSDVFRSDLIAEPSLSSKTKEREEWKLSLLFESLTHLGGCVILRSEMARF